MPRFRDDVTAMNTYVPGRRPEDLAAAHDRIVKLSANEWSGAPLPGVVEAVTAAAAHLNRYPEQPWELADLIAATHGCEPDEVILGPGSNTLLYWTALSMAGPGDEVVYPDPSFALYSLTAELSGAKGIPVRVDDDQRVDLDAMLAAVGESTRLVYICNPNNPTSTGLPADRIAAFVDQVDRDILIAVDEAYAEFGSGLGFGSALPLVAFHDNVVVYRTFSKIYGLAGARLGYAIGNKDTLAGIAKAGVPFSASSPAVAAATAAIQATSEVERRAAHIAAERTRVSAVLREGGHTVADSEANFVYVAAPDGIETSLEERGVIVRRYGSGWIRVTIGTVEENDAFLEAFGVGA